MSDQERSVTVPWRSSAFQTVLACSLIGIMGVPLISPVLPTLRGVFGISDTQAGLVITMYTLPGVLLTPFIGLLSDHYGRRTVVLPALFLFGASGMTIATSPPFDVVLLLRFLQGIGGSGLMVLAITMLGDMYDGEQRNAVIGVNGSAIGIGAATYPLLGGSLAALRWNIPFVFFGLSLLVGVVAVFTLEEPQLGHPPDIRTYLSRMASIVFLPESLVLWLAAFSAFFIFYGGILTALSLLLSDVYGFAPSQIGVMFAMVSLANAAIASQYGRIAKRLDVEQLVSLGFVGFGISLVGVWLTSSPAAIAVMLLCFGSSFGIVMPSLNTTAAGLASGRLRASMLGVLTSTLWLGQTVGPISFTFVAQNGFTRTVSGYQTLLLVVGAMALLGGSCLLLGLRVRR